MEAHGRRGRMTVRRRMSGCWRTGLSQWDAVCFENLFVVAILEETHHKGVLGDCGNFGIVKATIFPVLGEAAITSLPVRQDRCRCWLQTGMNGCGNRSGRWCCQHLWHYRCRRCDCNTRHGTGYCGNWWPCRLLSCHVRCIELLAFEHVQCEFVGLLVLEPHDLVRIVVESVRQLNKVLWYRWSRSGCCWRWRWRCTRQASHRTLVWFGSGH